MVRPILYKIRDFMERILIYEDLFIIDVEYLCYLKSGLFIILGVVNFVNFNYLMTYFMYFINYS